MMAASLRPCTRQLLTIATRRGCAISSSSLPRTCLTPASSHSTAPISRSFAAVDGSPHWRRMSSEAMESEEGAEEGKGPSQEAWRRGRMLQLLTGASTALIGTSYILYRQLHAEEGETSEECKEESKEEEKEKKKRLSFHDQRVTEYENRIRAYSTPDKIFRYFATINIKDADSGSSNIYMTPEDFLRSITPGDIQPPDCGLDKFRNMTLENWKKQYARKTVRKDSVFGSLGYYGLISFSDYLFLLTILATPARHFEIAFKMFDLNGDGEVDCEEFEKVQAVVLCSTAVGARHRDHGTTGSVAGSVGDALVEKFFGPNKDKRLTVEEFGCFHSQLLDEVMKLEFDRFDPHNGRISELDFARFILSYAVMKDQRRKKYYKRIKKQYGSELSPCPESQGGISFEDVKLFNKLVESIADVEMALSMYSAAGASITASDLKSVTKATSGLELSDNLVEFIITLFDEDGDGDLSYKEFIKVVKTISTRGLEKSKDLGFSKFLASITACSIKTVKDQIGLNS